MPKDKKNTKKSMTGTYKKGSKKKGYYGSKKSKGGGTK